VRHSVVVSFVSGDLERDAVSFSDESFVVAANNAPRRGNCDARWTPNTAVGGKILPRCSRPKVEIEPPTCSIYY